MMKYGLFNLLRVIKGEVNDWLGVSAFLQQHGVAARHQVAYGYVRKMSSTLIHYLHVKKLVVISIFGAIFVPRFDLEAVFEDKGLYLSNGQPRHLKVVVVKIHCLVQRQGAIFRNIVAELF